MIREDIVFVSDDLFSSRSTLLMWGKLKGERKVGSINKVLKENKACK